MILRCKSHRIYLYIIWALCKTVIKILGNFETTYFIYTTVLYLVLLCLLLIKVIKTDSMYAFN